MKILNYFFCCCFLFLCNIFLQAQPPLADAGLFQKICPGIGVGLGGAPTGSGGVGPLSYSWAPNNSTSPNPTVYPNITTTYTVTVSGTNGESQKDTITIFVYNASLNAGRDTTIQQGQTITMHAQANGASAIYWTPASSHIYNQNSATPDVFPAATTTYSVEAVFPNGCIVVDYVTVTVIQGGNLFFYNTFTPNGDGSNDFFYIGNIEKYPDNVLEIYNRYGQKVFTKTGYSNDWDGKYLNDELPAGTYFYVLDTKTSSGGKHKGSVTIIR